MDETGRTYLPAAGYHWSLSLYDPMVKLLGGEAARAMLLEQAVVRPGHRVLDIGCWMSKRASRLLSACEMDLRPLLRPVREETVQSYGRSQGRRIK